MTEILSPPFDSTGEVYRDTVDNLSADNPIGVAGYLIAATDRDIFAIADGVNGWNDLPKYRSSEGAATATNAALTMALTTNAADVAGLSKTIDCDGETAYDIDVIIPASSITVTGSTLGSRLQVFILDGTTVIGIGETQLIATGGVSVGAGSIHARTPSYVPTAGQHTIKAQGRRNDAGATSTAGQFSGSAFAPVSLSIRPTVVG